MKKVIIAMILVLLLACVCAHAETWTCPNCGQDGNTGNFCSNCATAAPSPEWACPNCGQTGNTGNFCTNCATARPDTNKKTDGLQVPNAVQSSDVIVNNGL